MITPQSNSLDSSVPDSASFTSSSNETKSVFFYIPTKALVCSDRFQFTTEEITSLHKETDQGFSQLYLHELFMLFLSQLYF